ncbi:MAG: cyclopropane-fatty-acyl-phospholipid synthase family protein [Xanthobacteraceae bacterium]|nr:cyclopropane-fatty-acyl-phospholipid synthase family protein [Xanthobacteraceae bacterium]
MNQIEAQSISAGASVSKPGLLARLFSRFLPQPDVGHLRIFLPDGGHIDLRGQQPGPGAVMTVHRWRGIWRIVRSGEAGFSNGYIAGDWSTPDLVGLFDFCICNETGFSSATDSYFAQFLDRLQHRANRNTKAGSRRNIAAHYDLGNDFYRCWLDKDLVYSSAIYNGEETLEEAQRSKLERVSEYLELSGGQHILEIGCGWGALAEHLVRKHDARVTAVTLSEEQLSHARERLLSDIIVGRADVRLQDYREISGRFDRVVSIEMFEAVGEQYWTTYFQKLKSCLAEQGSGALQIITIAPDRFKKYRECPDFIQRYIFPGGMLPTVDIIKRELTKAGLQIARQESFGLSYAQTLRDWRSRFLASWSEIEELGFDLHFKRMWEYYLAYCEIGFLRKTIDVSLFKIRHI